MSELDSWIAVDEEGNAELRVKYMFTDDYDRSAVGDAHVTVLGPDLRELAVVDVPTATGVLHGGEDNDGDGEADGIVVYGPLPAGAANMYDLYLWLREHCKRGKRAAAGEGGPPLGGDDDVRTVPLRIAFEFETYASSYALSELRQLKRLGDESWVIRGRWQATSGSAQFGNYVDRRNNYNHEWDGYQFPGAVGGPIPRTSSVKGDSGERHAVISTREEEPSGNLLEAMTVEENWSGTGVERVSYK